ncbi:uncharacterized protein Z520_04179 [Fonsecaea multimorphosa CBS 102226]|uniref:UDENN domain-containing protein n=1 Tax=Fonsecaea multimorphosa CBS 102226 TaxID=1442371 RepID=A0A0D2KUU2_9EURO|nr:uncharacterized protein Z520_04179 [Fonsecaea multimorphosa CBS 102226]KIY00494.1 hypothetical protein Z520_04179 [Fonsecaea multimorphosa CBS 102226]
MTTISPQVAVVDFHHARGPEVEFWIQSDGQNLYKLNDWSLLPFMALSDGAHAMAEEFSYFTLLDNRSPDSGPVETASSSEASPPGAAAVTSAATSLFGISCTRQIRTEKLKRRSVDVTRSTVQKAVVVISPTARGMGELRERLGIVTAAWFAQEDFSDISILKEFQESLVRVSPTHEDGKDHHFGLSLRELIYEFRHQTLALVKCLLLQRKMLFFGSKCERLCMMQFALISLIPGLIANLQDAADPSLDTYAQSAQKATSLRTGDRGSLLAFMGLPLQIFGKGSIFGPYTPLQQLDILADYDTKSYVVGSTNSLLLQQKEKYSDILINLDESNSMTITSPSLRAALALSAADRRWIDYLTQTVLDTWDPDNPSRPRNMGYAGSEDAIRMQFEEYILSLLSSMAYQIYHESLTENNIPASVANIESFPEPGDTASDFNPEFLAMWRSTNNFALFDRLTRGNRIFDIIEPRHPTGGGLSVEDLQRRVARGMADLHLDERVREGREQLGRTLQSGRERVEAGMASFWAQVEKAREQRAQQRATKRTSGSGSHSITRSIGEGSESRDTQETKPAAALSSASSNSSWMVVEQPEGGEAGAAGSRAQARPVSPPTSTSTSTSSTGTGGTWTATGSNWRAPRVDTSQIQASAREGAARAGAYLSGWGTWARQRMQQSQQGKEDPSQTAPGPQADETGAPSG